MKKIYAAPVCQMNFISDEELLTVAGSGEYIAWGQGEEIIFD